ncbi:MAG TPA: protein kinase [Gemmatimonadaceae bacterium]|nr:protein kinase [Gemmatimonadaceae bacterium]
MSDLIDRLERALGKAYVIERELGGGGMSRVFLAEQRSLGRKVVLKVLEPDLAAGISAERFAREAKLAAQLQHPHMVPVLAAGDADGLPYYVMPYVEGETLRSRLARSGRLPLRDAVAILRDVAKALSFAHARGIVHRDVKPENILLAGSSAVVSDFGIAKAITVARTSADTGLTQPGSAIGTPAYMAPEQAAGDPATDHRADIYAWGVLAYELVTGAPPFTGSSPYQIMAAHLAQPADPVATRREGISPQISELIERCLAKDPRDRPPSADVLLAMLEGADQRSGEPASSVPARRVRYERWIGVAAVSIVLVAAGAFAVMRTRDRDPALDVARVLVVQPAIESQDSPLGRFSAMTTDAVSEGLSRMSWAQVATRESAASGKEDLQAWAREANAAVVLTQQPYLLGDSVQLQLRISDGGTGVLIRALPAVRVAKDPGVAELRAAVDPVLTLIGYVTHPLLGSPVIPAAGPPRFDAFMEFVAATEQWQLPDSSAMIEVAEHLQAAMRLDSAFAQARLWFAAHAVRGYRWPSVAADLQRMLAVISNEDGQRSPFEQALTRYVLAGTGGSAGGRLPALRRLAAIAPRSVFASFLPGQLLDINRPREALATIDQFARESRSVVIPQAGGGIAGSYWAARADILHYLGEHREELEAAIKSRAADPTGHSELRRELRALVALKRGVEVERRLDEFNEAAGRGLFDFAGDAFLQLGLEMIAHGDSAAGARVIRRAIVWFEQRTPAEQRNEHVRFRSALAYYSAGDLERALPIVRQMHANSPDDPRYLGLMARVLVARGDSAAAIPMLAQLAAMPAGMLAGTPTYERAAIHAVLGRKAEATALLQESLQQGQGWNIRTRIHFFSDWLPFRDFPPFRAVITPQG